MGLSEEVLDALRRDDVEAVKRLMKQNHEKMIVLVNFPPEMTSGESPLMGKPVDCTFVGKPEDVPKRNSMRTSPPQDSTSVPGNAGMFSDEIEGKSENSPRITGIPSESSDGESENPPGYPREAPPGRLFLHEACRLGLEDIVNCLIPYYDDLGVETAEGPPLYQAVLGGYYGIVDSLLINKAPVPPAGSPWCVYYAAATHGWREILELLLQHRNEAGPPAAPSERHVSRLCLEGAVCGGHTALVKVCFNHYRRLHSCELTAQLMPELVTRACQNNHPEVVEFLLTCRAQLSPDVVATYPETLGRLLEMSLFPWRNDAEEKEEEEDGDPGQGHSQLFAQWSNKSLYAFSPLWLTPHLAAIVRLDVSNNHLTELPGCVPWALTSLQRCDLSHNNLLLLPSPPKATGLGCVRLQHLSVSHNNLASVPSEVFHIGSLLRLDLGHNKLASLVEYRGSMDRFLPAVGGPSPAPGPLRVDAPIPGTGRKSGVLDYTQLWSCLSLQYLDISHNALTQLPPQLHMCGQLVSLRAAHNQLADFLDPWNCPLEYLDLSGNLLTALPDNFNVYWQRSITKLYLQDNRLNRIPLAVCKLVNLQVLDVSHNALSGLPEPSWWVCKQLEELRLAHNCLAYDTPPSQSGSFLRGIARLRLSRSSNTDPSDQVCFPRCFYDTLVELDLSANQLRAVPPTVCRLGNLKQLLLNNNPELQTLPAELGNLQECFELGLAGTHINNIPRDLIHNTPLRTRAILAHLKYLLRRAEAYNSIKLMVVGGEKKGKSTLTALLQGKPAPTQECENSAIIIYDWKVSGFTLKRKVKGKVKREDFPSEVTFQIWDFAGPMDFYTTHKLFLSPSALYLVVYDLKTWHEGVHRIQPWLLDIEAHAPRSHVIIVGTFLDYLNDVGRAAIPSLHAALRDTYRPAHGYPQIDAIVEVSLKTSEGLDLLREEVYKAALGMEYRGILGKNTAFRRHKMDEKIVGRKVPKVYLDLGEELKKYIQLNNQDSYPPDKQVPRSYLDFGKELKMESYTRRRNAQMPIMNTQQILDIAGRVANSDISSPEELDLAVSFLHEAGYILHYPSTLRGLNELYFTDPCWLADSLARIISVNCVRDGLLDLGEAQALLFTEATHRSATLGQLVELLEKFEIALLVDDKRLLLPSKLQNIRPSSIEDAEARSNAFRLHRVYHQKCVPSGFWPRLIIQVITMLQRVCQQIIFPIELAGSSEDGAKEEQEWDRMRVSYGSLPLATRPVHVSYWRQGIALDFKEGILIMESTEHLKQQSPAGSSRSKAPPETSGTSQEPSPSCTKSPEGGTRSRDAGVIITIAADKRRNFSVMGFAVDQLECVITQWFPGLNDDQFPLERLIPCPGCVESLPCLADLPTTHSFTVQDAASKYLANEHVKFACPQCGRSEIHPEDLIPDFTLSDLPHNLHLNIDDISMDKDTDLIGSGGEGRVYRGTFNSEDIAFKQSAVVETIAHLRPQILDDARSPRTLPWELAESAEVDRADASMVGHVTRREGHSDGSNGSGSSLDTVKYLVKFKLLPAFQDFRKEVSLLSTLSHGCVVSILGVLPPHLAYVMELAPRGSLHDVLERSMAEQGQAQRADPGRRGGPSAGLLGIDITCKIVYQLSCGLAYLHKRRVVYKDLKPRNVLVWSLDPGHGTNVKLSDYGLSSYLTPQGVKGCEGTLGYQAPEMRKGTSYNEKVDIFSLGMVIYQLFTGEQLFANLPSVAIPKHIQTGKRPSLRDAHVRPSLPKLVSLMETCWSTDPALRPVSAQITASMRHPSFWALRQYPDRDVNPVRCVHRDTESPEDTAVHFVSESDTSATYNVLNPATGHMTLEQPISSRRVTCVVCLRHAIVVGAEDHSIRLYSVGRQQEICAPLVTADTPLAMVYRDVQDPENYDDAFIKELIVSFADGSLSKYIVCMTSKTKATVCDVATKKLGDPGAIPLPIKVLMFMDERRLLWIGHGCDIVVMETDGLSVIDRVVCSDDKNKTLSDMCCVGDQVWCFHRNSFEVLEIDVRSLTILCRFDCSLGSEVGVQTVHWCHQAKRSSQASLGQTSNSTDSNSEDRKVQRHSQSRATLRVKSSSSFASSDSSRSIDSGSFHSSHSWQRKNSIRCHSLKTRPLRRSSTFGNPHREPHYQVRSLLCVNGALWVGRKCGDIMLINVLQSNPCDYTYGEVIAVLCNEYLNGFGNGSVEHLALTSGHVTAMRAVNRPAGVRRSSMETSQGTKAETVVWESVSVEQIHTTQGYWNQ